MTLVVMMLSILAGTFSLAYAYFQEGYAQPALWIVMLGGAWLLAERQRVYWFASAALLLVLFAAGLGIWQGLPLAWMFAGGLGGLLGWDLSDFARRLRYTAPTDNVTQMERRHLARVGIVALLGAGLAYWSTMIQIAPMTFEAAVVLSLLTAFVLARWVMNSRKY